MLVCSVQAFQTTGLRLPFFHAGPDLSCTVLPADRGTAHSSPPQGTLMKSCKWPMPEYLVTQSEV